MIFAQLDSDRAPVWWIRQASGRYEEWEPLIGRSGNLPKRRVPAHRLTPAKKDFEVFTGDTGARMELYEAKNRAERASA